MEYNILSPQSQALHLHTAAFPFYYLQLLHHIFFKYVFIFDIIKFHFSSSVKKRDDITRLFFRFSLYGGDSPTFLGFHFMVETHLRQSFVYNKYMQFLLKNQYNSTILSKYKPPKEFSLRGLKFFSEIVRSKNV